MEGTQMPTNIPVSLSTVNQRVTENRKEITAAKRKK
jgi:hypothetical protein